MATSPEFCLARPNVTDDEDEIRLEFEKAIDHELHEGWEPGDVIKVELEVASKLSVEATKEIFDWFVMKYSFRFDGVTYFGIRNGQFTREDKSITFRLVFPQPTYRR